VARHKASNFFFVVALPGFDFHRVRPADPLPPACSLETGIVMIRRFFINRMLVAKLIKVNAILANDLIQNTLLILNVSIPSHQEHHLHTIHNCTINHHYRCSQQTYYAILGVGLFCRKSCRILSQLYRLRW
jgi:hypothetical protein